MRKILHAFNMIEIVLAIGVVAFGVTAVMALLPPALNANRDVAADAFVDEAVSKMRLLVNVFMLQNWDTNIKNGIPQNGPTTATVWGPKGDNIFKSSTYPEEMRQWKISKTNVDNILYLESSDETFAAYATIWKKQADPIYNGDFDKNDTTFTCTARLNIEISWPVNANWENRQKRLIAFDVSKK